MGSDFDNSDNNGSLEPNFSLDDSDLEFGKCPQCKKETLDLEIIEELLKLSLIESDVAVEYDAVCEDCITELTNQITHVGKMKAEKKQRLELLLKKWNSKTNILKTGRSLMSQKIYPDAKKHFEDYIEILEAIFNKGEEGLQPIMISEEHRKYESTIICYILWDLIFIYDQFEPGTAQLKYLCDQLCDFLPHARKQSSLIAKIKKHIKESKNPELIKALFNRTKNLKGSCFIATAVFNDPYSLELSVLRNFRDHFLKKSRVGRHFIFYYYKYSPSIADKIKTLTILRVPIKYCLKLVSFVLVKLNF